jgi:hypothetical protein
MSGAISAVSAAGAAAAAGGASTLGVAAAAAAANAGAIGLIGTGLSAASSIAGGMQQAQSAKYNAQIQSNNAQIAQQNATFAGEEGAANAGAEQQKTRAQVGGIKAAQAANNVDVNSGSAVDVRSSAAELGELNAITIRSNAARTAYGYQTAAASDTAQAALDKQQAQYDTEAGVVKAGTTLLGNVATGAQNGMWNSFLNEGAMGSVTTGSGAVTSGTGGLY